MAHAQVAEILYGDTTKRLAARGTVMGKLHTIGNIQIRIYAGDHRPAHFHVVHPDYEAQIEILSLVILRGSLPGRDRRTITQWAVANQTRLIATWNDLNPALAL